MRLTTVLQNNENRRRNHFRLRSLKAVLRTAVIVVTVAALCSGCNLSAQKIEFEKAESAFQAKEFPKALEHYDNVVRRYVKSDLALRSADSAARIAYYETKDFGRAIEYFKHIVLYSSSSEARLEAQRKIAEIQYEHLQDYKQAIIEYNRLLELPHSPTEGLSYRLAIARSYFYQKNFFQALVEVEGIMTRDFAAKDLFDPLELKASILLQTRRLDEAIEVLQQLLTKYPGRSKERQIGLVLAVCYEEKKDFAKAIETLNSIKDTYPSPEFIEGRIKNLRERQSYLPGAKGLRK